jgi:geranylgeranyl reductase family protein
MYDVIVVGAGPAGASSAYHLARAGFKTLMLEKEKMPRYKPCGGGLTAKVRRALDFDFSPAVEQTITAASVAYASDRMRLEFETPVAWCVMRDKFDMLLAQRAANAGADVRDGQPAIRIDFDAGGADVVTAGEKLRTRLVVGADGANGLVRRAAAFPLHNRIIAALEAEMEAEDAALEEWQGALHLDFGAIPWGYSWIFPKAKHLSVGIGALMRGRPHPDLRAELGRYVGWEPSLRHARYRLTRGHRIPIGGKSSTYHSPRAVLVGDAAGVADPFTGEGIYYALLSGLIAAEEIARAIQRGDGLDLSGHTRRINAEINSDLRTAWLFTNIFSRMPSRAYRVFKRSGSTRTAVTEMVNGSHSYGQMLRRVIKSAARSLLPGSAGPAKKYRSVN